MLLILLPCALVVIVVLLLGAEAVLIIFATDSCSADKTSVYSLFEVDV